MNVSDLREILQYVPRFRERVFVIAFDGEVAASDNFSNILLDLAVLRSLSVKGRSRARRGVPDRQAGARTWTSKLTNADGTGITDEVTLQVSIDAAIRLTNQIMEGLSAVDLRAAYVNAIIAHPAGILRHRPPIHGSGRTRRCQGCACCSTRECRGAAIGLRW